MSRSIVKKTGSWDVLMILIYLLLLIIGIFTLVQSIAMKSNMIEQVILINDLSFVLLIIGSLLIIIGTIGILSFYCLNKILITFTFLLLVIMLVVHGYYFFVLVSNKSPIENNFKEQLQKTVNNLNSNNTNTTQDCNYMKKLSSYFHCCGFNGTSDFFDSKTAHKCCIIEENEPGCAQVIIEKITEKITKLMIIPSSVIFCIEFFFMLAAVLVCTFSGKNNYNVV